MFLLFLIKYWEGKYMNKRFVQIALTSVVAASTFGVIAVSSMQDSKALFADNPKTETQYTISSWDLVGQSSNFFNSAVDEYSAGFFFSPKTGRKDIVLGIVVQSHCQNTPEDEELIFEQDGTNISYRSYRKWYTPDAGAHYYYEDDINHQKSFVAARMTYMVGKVKEESPIFELDELDNFSVVSISVHSWFAYNWMDTPGATSSDFYNWFEYYKEMVRVFTPSNPADSNVADSHGFEGNSKCTGFKMDTSSLTLTYSCSY